MLTACAADPDDIPLSLLLCAAPWGSGTTYELARAADLGRQPGELQVSGIPPAQCGVGQAQRFRRTQSARMGALRRGGISSPPDQGWGSDLGMGWRRGQRSDKRERDQPAVGRGPPRNRVAGAPRGGAAPD